jgi:hypothetical protein
MANLISCSQILYNQEISNQKKITTDLKNRSIFYEYPKIKYSKLEWETTYRESQNIIKNGLYKWVVEDEFEYNHMDNLGITPRQMINIPCYIEEALNLITKNKYKEWSKFNSNNIIGNISTCFNGFITVDNDIISQLYPEKMSNLLFTIISDYLDELCQDIPIYICDVCKRELIYNEDKEEEICEVCQ